MKKYTYTDLFFLNRDMVSCSGRKNMKLMIYLLFYVYIYFVIIHETINRLSRVLWLFFSIRIGRGNLRI